MRREERKPVVRCLNCFTRIEVAHGAQTISCPNCGVRYLVAQRGRDVKIMGEAKEGK